MPAFLVTMVIAGNKLSPSSDNTLTFVQKSIITAKSGVVPPHCFSHTWCAWLQMPFHNPSTQWSPCQTPSLNWLLLLQTLHQLALHSGSSLAVAANSSSPLHQIRLNSANKPCYQSPRRCKESVVGGGWSSCRKSALFVLMFVLAAFPFVFQG